MDGCDGGHYVKPALLAGSLDNGPLLKKSLDW